MIFVLMSLIGNAGVRTGVPYPVLARASFGVWGANIPALARAIVACFWYGAQTAAASGAIVALLTRMDTFKSFHETTHVLGHSGLEVICFVVIWALQLLIIQRGMETVRRFQDWAGPAVWLMMLVLAVYLCIKAGGISLIAPIPQDVLLEKTREAGVPGVPGSLAALGAVAATWVTYFAALYLNFCDFSRYAPDAAAVRKGNIWGLPVNLILFSLVAGITTIAAFNVYQRGAAASRPDLGEVRQLVSGAARGAHLCGGDARHQCGRQFRFARVRFLQRLSKTYRLQEGRLYRSADRAGAVSLRAVGRQCCRVRRARSAPPWGRSSAS